MIRVGIVGSGFGGSVHAPAFAAHPAFAPVAIASPTSAERVARERNIPHAFSSLEAMLDGVELDAVAIASPPFAHHDQALLAFAGGKHVLCEKPLALSVGEVESMIAARDRAGVVAGVAHEFRFVPSRIATKELIENGHLGALREIEATNFRTWLRAANERPASWWFDRSKGGGIAGAIGSHLIDTANWLAGRAPVRTTGFIRTANVERHGGGTTFTSTVDDGAFALLDYGEGLIARITVDGTTVIDSMTLAVHGETRSVVGTGSGGIETTTFTIDADETAELELKASPYARFGTAHPNLPPFLSLLDAFAAAIDGKPNDLPTFEDALVTQRVLAAIGF